MFWDFIDSLCFYYYFLLYNSSSVAALLFPSFETILQNVVHLCHHLMLHLYMTNDSHLYNTIHRREWCTGASGPQERVVHRSEWSTGASGPQERVVHRSAWW